MAKNVEEWVGSVIRVVWLTLLTVSGAAMAQTGDRAVDDAFALNACLNAWGRHPFGSHLTYTTLNTSVKISGAGPATADQVTTNHPSLILVDPLVNARGDAHIALMNANGWYCLRSPAHQMGALHIELHCRARMASAAGGVTIWGTGGAGTGPTTMGSAQVERMGCN